MPDYERTAAMAVQTVTDHDSALVCVRELESYLKSLLKAASKLLPEVLLREGRSSSSAFISELRRRLLPRSEDAHKVARSDRPSQGESTECAVGDLT
jgi:hypothetical protein